jgi:hypothetical protein
LNQGNKSRPAKSGGPMGWNASVDLALTAGCSAGETGRDGKSSGGFLGSCAVFGAGQKPIRQGERAARVAATNDRPAALFDKSNHKLGLPFEDRSPWM